MMKTIHSGWRRAAGVILIMLGISSGAFYFLQMHTISQSIAATNQVITYTMPSHAPVPVPTHAVSSSASEPRPPSSTQPVRKVKLSTATQADLEQLPRIGPKTAQSILAYREQHGFKSIDELMKIKGIGSKTFVQIKPFLEL